MANRHECFPINVKLYNKEEIWDYFDIFKRKGLEEENEYTGETPPCPRCGEPLTKKYVYSEMYCTNCDSGLDDDEDDDNR